jgi:hypothetical protein
MTRLILSAILTLNLLATAYCVTRIHALPTFLHVETDPDLSGVLTGVSVPCMYAPQVAAADEWFSYNQRADEAASRCYVRASAQPTHPTSVS